MAHENKAKSPLPSFKSPPHVAVIEARFYDALNDQLVDGAVEILNEVNATHEVITVPGALEIPVALLFTSKRKNKPFDAFVVLGCVIRGATTHYETVCNESARGITDAALDKKLAVGNGIITVENQEQAFERADKTRLNKGGDAARAALVMLKLKQDCEL